MEKVKSSIENLEIETARSLEAARAKANEILSGANEESQQILNSPFSFSEIQIECKKIIETARRESDLKIDASKQQAESLRTRAEKRVDAIVNSMVKAITEE